MVREELKQALSAALSAAVAKGELPAVEAPPVILETPPDKRFGDFSCNLAMTLAPLVGRPPRAVAEVLVRHLRLPEGRLERTEIAGPGFLNFHLHPAWLRETVRQILAQGERCGRSDIGGGQRVNLEFVSANPTGPLVVANGRQAAFGDCLARLLECCGYSVTREYYINDADRSTQVQKFGESLEARYRQIFGEEAPVPEDGYQGEYVAEMARAIAAEAGDRYLSVEAESRRKVFRDLALNRVITGQQADLAEFGVSFDVWFRESDLFARGAVEETLAVLREGGHTYESEDALWLRTTAYGDEKDRVLVRATGAPSYLAADVAYHRDKFSRGFDRLIDVWGPDHHGHIARTKAGVQALGYPTDRVDILIVQIVRLYSGGEMVRMSKRAGELVLLKDLVADVGGDAARFFFLMRSHDSPLDFDLELAKQESPENPVYYVQYGHARICSILREAEERGVSLPDPGQVNFDRPEAEDELALMRKLADLPEEVQLAAAKYEPHRMTRYAQELARAFHSFYTTCRVLGEDSELTAARLSLVIAARHVLRNTLQWIGVRAPERM